MGVLYANVGGTWVPVSSAGGGGGSDEVFVGPNDPIATAPTTELWFDTDAPTPTPGFGIPSGGTPGQVLTRKSNTDYDASWQSLPWYLPWGRLGHAVKSGDQGGFDTTARDISGLALTVPVVVGRMVKLTMFLYFATTVANAYVQMYITTDTNSQLQIGAHTPGTVSASTTLTGILQTTSTTLSIKGRLNCGSGNVTVQGSVAQCFLMAEDIGPAAGVTPP